MEKNNNMDEHLKRTLEEFEVQPDIRSFHEVIRKMNEKKKRRRFIIFFWFGFLLLGASTFSLFNFFSSQNKNTITKTISKTDPLIVLKNKTRFEKAHTSPSKESVPLTTNDVQQKTDPVNINSSEVKTSVTERNSIKDQVSSINTGVNNNSTTNNSKNKIKNNVAAIKKAAVNLKEEEMPSEKFIPEDQAISFLSVKDLYLPADTTLRELLTVTPDTLNQPLAAVTDSLKDKKKKIRFYIGINLEPKLSSYLYSKNTHRNTVYNDASDFAAQYLKGKKEQNAFRFNYAFGFKAGLNIREKYEVSVGFGFQNFKKTEKLYDYRNSTPALTHPSAQYSFAFSDAEAGSKTISNFNYYYYSIDASRIYRLSSKIHYKIGLGFQANQLRHSYFIFVTSPNVYINTDNEYNPIAKWTYTTSFKSGIMFDAGKRWQFQVCPNIFYSPSSIYKNDYVIKERPYGFSVECAILFRLF